MIALANMPANSLLKNPRMPHAKGAKAAKFPEEIPLGVLCGLCVRLFQQAGKCREALECGGLTPLSLSAERACECHRALRFETGAQLSAATAIDHFTRLVLTGKSPSSRRSPKARATTGGAILKMIPLVF